MRFTGAGVILLAMALGLAGCSSGDHNDPLGPGGPSIDVINLHDGDSVPAGMVNVQVRVEGMMMDCGDMGGMHMDGVGHWHVDVDGEEMGMSCDDHYEMDLSGLAPGPHTMMCSLHGNDHMEYPKSTPARLVLNVQGGQG